MVEGRFVLEKFPGKGGWTYAALPDVYQDKTRPFGSRQVKGMLHSDTKKAPRGGGAFALVYNVCCLNPKSYSKANQKLIGQLREVEG